MSQGHHHHHHGNVIIGRMMVAAGCLLILVANGLIFKRASAHTHPMPALELVTVAMLLWFCAGVWGMFTRMPWTRYLTLTILYVGSLGWFLTGVVTFFSDDSPLAGYETSFFVATVIYLYVSLVFTHSRHIQRLTSRAYE
ncbi:MAG TPA: hypothetical protein VHY22_16830 [Chthoniobacteraceae bacterium]|jgi:hypothetical protein|nr:hypothetical protein [Chthoniobacteraceae bacterium]